VVCFLSHGVELTVLTKWNSCFRIKTRKQL